MRLIILILFFTTVLKGQDVQYSQIETTPAILNPSLIGSMDRKVKLTAKYRSLWNSVLKDLGYQNYFASVTFKHCLDNNFLGGGISFQREQLGNPQFYNTNIIFSISYHQMLNRNLFLGVGFNGSLMEYGFDVNTLQFDQQFDGIGFNPSLNNLENFTTDRKMQPNIDLGMSLYNTENNWILGFALFHLNQPNFSFLDTFNDNSLGIGASAHGAITFYLDSWKKKSLLLRGIYRKQALFNNGHQWQFQGGAVLQLHRWEGTETDWDFSIGLAARLTGNDAGQAFTLDAFIPSVNFSNDQFSIHFSYDTNVSSLAKSTMLRGAMEVTVTYALGEQDNCIGCPIF